MFSATQMEVSDILYTKCVWGMEMLMEDLQSTLQEKLVFIWLFYTLGRIF